MKTTMTSTYPIPNKNNLISILKESVDNHSLLYYKKSHNQKEPYCIDVQTTNLILKVENTLKKPKNRELFFNMLPHLDRLGSLCWKLVKK